MMEPSTHHIPWESVRWAVDFLPHFEAPDFAPGQWVWPPKEEGFATLPMWVANPTVMRFIEGLYERDLIVPFDWPNWAYGRLLMTEPHRIPKATARTCLRLLTMHVRAERFNEGHLASTFDNGQMATILRRLKVLVEGRVGP